MTPRLLHQKWGTAWITGVCGWQMRRSGSREVARALLEGVPRGRHPSVRDRNKRGLTPLGEALALGRADMAQLLVTQVCFTPNTVHHHEPPGRAAHLHVRSCVQVCVRLLPELQLGQCLGGGKVCKLCYVLGMIPVWEVSLQAARPSGVEVHPLCFKTPLAWTCFWINRGS